MDIVLGPNRYGKAEVRLVRVTRGEQHEIIDLNVSIALAGDLRPDRPYGLIEGTVLRDGAPPPIEEAWS